VDAGRSCDAARREFCILFALSQKVLFQKGNLSGWGARIRTWEWEWIDDRQMTVPLAISFVHPQNLRLTWLWPTFARAGLSACRCARNWRAAAREPSDTTQGRHGLYRQR
jgi:hypothetical protein